MHIDRMALGQGGLSDEPMWDARLTEIRALQTSLIRLFIQDYFQLLSSAGGYHFDTLDRSVDTILAAGAKPLMAICFKPRRLFPEVDQDIVEPNDYAAWEELIFRLVRHYKERDAGIVYWEVANEPDLGESGGCPYRFQPESYVRYYRHTVAAILRADPQARVGGPALADWKSPILPALLECCAETQTPLHFVSWHTYTNDPKEIRGTIEGVRELLEKFPTLHPETFIDEWNMHLFDPPLDPRFQPCFVAEAVWQMKEAGLDYSCYFHIQDWYVSLDQIGGFMGSEGTAFMARWWNRMPQFSGLFDYQKRVRPAYFAFKLLSRLRGERLRLSSSVDAVHGFAAYDEQLLMTNVLIWNFSTAPIELDLTFQDVAGKKRKRHIVLDAAAASDDEAARLRPDPFGDLPAGDSSQRVTLEPYAIHYWTIE